MVTRGAENRQRVTASLAVATLLALLGVLTAPLALAQGSEGLVIRRMEVASDGTTTIAVSLPPGADPVSVAESIDILENGALIEDFDAAPIQIGGGEVVAEAALLIDTSGSTGGETNAIASARTAAKNFVRSVTDQGVPVTLIAFADAPRVLATQSTDVDQLTASIDALEAAGDTALYDAVVEATRQWIGAPTGRQRNIVIFTDGQDDGSTAGFVDAVTAVEAAGAIVTSVALETDFTDVQPLQSLADATGGSVLEVSAAAGLDDALGEVASAITSQLLITWFSDNITDVTLTITVSALVDGRPVSATRATRNLRNPVPPQPEPVPVPPSGTRVVSGGPALALGLLATAGAVLVLGVTLFVSPASSRSSRILKRQLEPSSRARRDKPVDDIRIKERVAAVMDAVPKPSGYDAALQLQLDQAAWPLRSGEFLALSVGLSVAGLVLGAVGGRNLLLGLTLAVVGGFVPRLILLQRQQRRAQLFHDQLPDTLQMLAGSLRAGYGLMQGLDNVSSEGQPPTATEFGRVLTETRLGVPLEDALSAMAERVGSEDFRWVTVAVSIQRKVGGNLAELLDTVARTLRDREQVRRQVKVLSAEGRLSAVILVALPVAFALYLGVTRPDYLAPLFNTSIGRMLLGAAVALMGLGVVWVRSVIRIDV